MSDYKVIREVSLLLRDTLLQGFASSVEPDLQSIGQDSIALMNPADTAESTDRRLSVWLYSVQINEFMRNALPSRLPDSSRLRYPPLAINLYYLITPFETDVEKEQLLLGRTMQILHDNATLTLWSREDPANNVELRVTMVQRDLRELAEVWEALQQPYHLSVCYQVSVVAIDSTRVETATRVSERITDFQENPKAEAFA
jgi:hypothetical protein